VRSVVSSVLTAAKRREAVVSTVVTRCQEERGDRRMMLKTGKRGRIMIPPRRQLEDDYDDEEAIGR
jgi:hypothetical protein